MSAPLTTDILAPFDPTGYASITGAQLLQLISGAYPQTDKGMIVVTTDTGTVAEVPDATTTTKWQNYIWLRKTATSVIPYNWNANASNQFDQYGNALLKWQSIAISSLGVGTITTDMLADLCVTDDKIANVDWSKVLNAPTGFAPSGAAGGVLSGTYPNPGLADNAVTSAKITDLNVTNSKLEVGSAAVGVELTKLKWSGVVRSMVRTKAGPAEAEWFVPSKVIDITDPASAADALKMVAVKSPYTDGYELVIPPVVQTVYVYDATNKTLDNATYHTQVAGGTFLFNEGHKYTELDLAITKKFASTRLHVEVTIGLSSHYAGATDLGFAVYMNPTAANIPLYLGYGTTAIVHQQVIITASMVVPATAVGATLFYVNIGSARAEDISVNAPGGVPNFGGMTQSSIKVTEIV